MFLAVISEVTFVFEYLPTLTARELDTLVDGPDM